MKNIRSSLFIVCVLMCFISSTLSETDSDTDANNHPEHDRSQPTDRADDVTNLSDIPNERDDVHNNNERIHQRNKSHKPLRNIVMGIYKNYKSTYLGNKTLTEYKQTLRESMKTKHQLQQTQTETESPEGGDLQAEAKDDEAENQASDATEETVVTISTELPDVQKPPQQEAEKDDSPAKEQAKAQEQNYHIGPALNMSLDFHNSIVKVNLDGESLKELITGRWLNDNSDEGRGKKYEMVTRILPLFILPFLIQSAIVPFLVTKLKLLLMKSLLVGKLAIFLLIISAFRNGNKMMQTYEVAPSYWASEPSRRSEMAAAASSMAYNGYRVEGKPAAWVN